MNHKQQPCYYGLVCFLTPYEAGNTITPSGGRSLPYGAGQVNDVRVSLGLLAAVSAIAGFVWWWGSGGDAAQTALPLSDTGKAAVALVQSRGCLACHSLDGSPGIGPSWAGTYGTERLLQDGSSVVMDEAYLRRSVQEPAAQVLQGFDNVMVPASFTDAELRALTGLLQELGAAAGTSL